MGNRVKFTVECEMEGRWVDDFLSFLHMLEYDGIIGYSQWVAIYSDGDGDFRPKFNPSIKYRNKSCTPKQVHGKIPCFDAG